MLQHEHVVKTPVMPQPEHPALHREQFTGTWHLIDFRAHSSDGDVVYPYGTSPVGMMMYDTDGHMAMVFMRTGESTFKEIPMITDWETAAKAIEAAFEGLHAYCGTYTIDAQEGSITHHVTAGNVAQRKGRDQVRKAAFCCGQLCLSSPPVDIFGKQWRTHAIWQRVTE